MLDQFPVKDVCDWFGNSPAIVAKHYAQARSEVTERGKSETTAHFEGSNGVPMSEKRGQNGAHP